MQLQVAYCKVFKITFLLVSFSLDTSAYFTLPDTFVNKLRMLHVQKPKMINLK